MPPPWTSQNLINDFWLQHLTPNTPPVKASAVLPKDFYKAKVSKRPPRGDIPSVPVSTSYDAAVAACQKKVAHIVRECQAMNLKYSDPYFDLDDKEDCMYELTIPDHKDDEDVKPNRGLNLYEENGGGERKGHLLLFGSGDRESRKPPLPPSVKRVGDIFDNPQFYVDGATAMDVRQGGSGDCWFMSALMALCTNKGTTGSLLEKVCVARDPEVGVYGFVVFRDGEWESVIIDDKLYLRKPDYEDLSERARKDWDAAKMRENSAEDWRMEFQRNSGALWFAQSTNENETWVPLLEKAYAKAHGDYGAIHGGSVGEAMEDLTGGVHVMLRSKDILSKERLWQDLLKVNTEYLFGCASPNWDDADDDGGLDGIQANHAYSILRAVEYKHERLLLVKNPWGRKEWKGAWADGSKEWTHESIKDLGHVFGDDGIFWIRYQDLLRKYDEIYRTRLFSDEWRVAQQWASVDVPWTGDYLNTKFAITLEKSSQTVIILSQLDERYFRGLAGQYVFNLSFRVRKKGEDDYLMRTYGEFYGQRSVNAELFLEAGTYEVRLKVAASRDEKAHKVEDVVKENWLERREKLLQVGLLYDIAHAKGQLEEEEEKDEDNKRGNDEKEDNEDKERKDRTDEQEEEEEEEEVEENEKKEENESNEKKDEEAHTATTDAAVAQEEGVKENEWEDEEADGIRAGHPHDYPPRPRRGFHLFGRRHNHLPGPPRGPRRHISPGPSRNFPPNRPDDYPRPTYLRYRSRSRSEERDIPIDGPRVHPRGYPHHSPPESPILPPKRGINDAHNDDASMYYDTSVNHKAWGASAVVGLRVYCRDADAVVKVIRPGDEVATDESIPDVDDPARDAEVKSGVPTPRSGKDGKNRDGSGRRATGQYVRRMR